MQRFRIAAPVEPAGAERIEKTVQALPGVAETRLQPENGQLEVEFSAPATRESICRAVEEAGFNVLPPAEDEAPLPEEPAAHLARAARTARGFRPAALPPLGRALAQVVCLALVVGGLGLAASGFLPLPPAVTQNVAVMAGLGLAQLGLTLCAAALALPLLKAAGLEAKNRRPGVALPPVLSAAVLLAYGLWRLVDSVSTRENPAGPWLAASAGVLAVGLLALLLMEELARRTHAPFAAMEKLAPATAHRLEPTPAEPLQSEPVTLAAASAGPHRFSGAAQPENPTAQPAPRETAVAAGELCPGDRFIVSPGEIVPADGVVEEGTSALTHPALGETAPRDVFAGAPVAAAAVNGSGTLICRATRTGADTVFAQALHTAAAAAETPAALPAPFDKALPWVLPAAAVAAVVMGAVWLAVGRSDLAVTAVAALLAAACPCAFAAAWPAAISACCGTGLAHGLLFRDAEAMARLSTAQTLLADRSSVVSDGEPRVIAVIGTRKVPEKFLLGLAAGLELSCDHPIARAILVKARAEGIPLRPVANFCSLPGKGLTGTIAGKLVAGGNAEFIGEQCPIDPALLDAAAALNAQGATPLFFSLDRHAAGIVGVADVVRPASREALAALQAMGLRVWLCTGESAANAAHLAGQVGLTAGQTAPMEPSGSLAAVAAAQPEPTPGLMASACPGALSPDGKMSVLVGTGDTDTAPLPPQDLILLSGNLGGLPLALRLCRQLPLTLQNTLWAGAAANLVVLLLAAGVLYPLCGLMLHPVVAALFSVLLGALPCLLAARGVKAALAAPARPKPENQTPEPKPNPGPAVENPSAESEPTEKQL